MSRSTQSNDNSRCHVLRDLSTVYLTLDMPLLMPVSLNAPSSAQSPSEIIAAAGTSSPSPPLQPQQLSVPLPLSPHTTLHIQITPLEKSTIVFLTTTYPSSSSSLSALGSFVYSIPNVPFPCQLPDLSSSSKEFTDKACHASDCSLLNLLARPSILLPEALTLRQEWRRYYREEQGSLLMWAVALCSGIQWSKRRWRL